MDEIGPFDKVELYFEEDDEIETIQVVTTVLCDPLQRRVSQGSTLWAKRCSAERPGGP